MSAVQIQFTTPDEALGRRIGDALIDERLAACAQSLGPITSTYWWRGTKETAATTATASASRVMSSTPKPPAAFF